MIRFLEESHQYFDEQDVEYISVTTFVGSFKAKYDGEFWSAYKAIESILGMTDVVDERGRKAFTMWLKRNGLGFCLETKTTDSLKKVAQFANISWLQIWEKQQELKTKWKDKSDAACAKGTAFHNLMEKTAHDTGIDIVTELIEGVLPQRPHIATGVQGKTKLFSYRSLAELEDGAYPELAVWLEEARIAGKIDKPFIFTKHDGKRYVTISDYKTNDKLTFSNPVKEKYKFPIQHLEVCKFNDYALQLNMYAYILAQSGFIVDKLFIEHNIVEPITLKVLSSKLLEVPNLQADVAAMVKWRINQFKKY
jgi:hypothetical protein